MTYLGGSDLGAAEAVARAEAVDRRVHTAIATCQWFLVIRIMSVLVMVSFLPQRLPTVSFRLDATHVLVVPLGALGLTSGMALMVIAGLSAIEMYLVYRLADRVRPARFLVILIESVGILVWASALAVGATLAALPLGLAGGAIGLLLLNQVRWAFRLQHQRELTGRRLGGVFAGYAGNALDKPKAAQPVGYSVRDGQPPR
ncbi:MAG: hypothetical protein WCB85_00960 [Candidatus Dormiibacterota bacterium]